MTPDNVKITDLVNLVSMCLEMGCALEFQLRPIKKEVEGVQATEETS